MEPLDRLDASLISRMVDLGRRSDLESPGVLDSFKDLQSYDWINRLAWSTWDRTVAELSIEETASLARALAISHTKAAHSSATREESKS